MCYLDDSCPIHGILFEYTQAVVPTNVYLSEDGASCCPNNDLTISMALYIRNGETIGPSDVFVPKKREIRLEDALYNDSSMTRRSAS